MLTEAQNFITDPDGGIKSTADVYIYGKAETRPFRKMGHVTLIAETVDEAIEKAKKVRELLKVNAHE